MTHVNSRQSMLFNSKTRTDTKPAWQRRRFTKTSATVNGEYDPDLALAIQESLKQAEIDALKAKEKQESRVLEIESEACKENRVVNMSRSSTLISNETKQLKDLVSVHMDLIQQQQDVINQKDKTIKTLKADNNALQCRLQRMERRLALLKQKEEMGAVGGAHIVQSPPPKPGSMSYTEPIVSPPPEKHAYKRRQENLGSGRRLPVSYTSRQSSVKFSNLTTSATEQAHSRPEPSKRRRLAQSHTADADSSLLHTNNLYHVSYYEPVSDEIDLEPRPDIVRGAESQIEVECPSYRIKSYTNLYVIEGTEDHEDETFIRRHQKPEIEERRRKRWDNQRLRDEKMYEKLKESRPGAITDKHKKGEEPVESFYSRLEDITHIEVLDKLVVTAFGQPVPFVKSEDFTLPWTSTPAPCQRPRHR